MINFSRLSGHPSWVWLLVIGFAAGSLGCVSSDPWAAYESLDPEGNIFVQGYGNQRPRYGHGGTESPSARRAREEQERRIAATEQRKRREAKREQARLDRIEEQRLEEQRNSNREITPPDSLADDTPELPEGADDVVTTVDEPDPQPEAPPEPAPQPVPTQESLSYGRPVPGKPGMVYSPYSPDAGYVDVRGIAPGTKVKCPYTKKLFRVP